MGKPATVQPATVLTLIRLCRDDGLPVAAAARQLGIGRLSARYWLRQAGVRLRPHRGGRPTVIDAATVAVAVRLCRDEQVSLSAAARRCGVPYESLRRACQRQGIEAGYYQRPTPAQEAEVVCRYQSDGQTIAEIVAATGLTEYGVRKILQRERH